MKVLGMFMLISSCLAQAVIQPGPPAKPVCLYPTPFLQDGKCVTVCSLGRTLSEDRSECICPFFIDNGVCRDACDATKVGNAQKICTPIAKPVCAGGQILDNSINTCICKDSFFNEATKSCVFLCPKFFAPNAAGVCRCARFLDGVICVDACPATKPLVQNGNCVIACDLGFNKEGNNCVPTCPVGQFYNYTAKACTDCALTLGKACVATTTITPVTGAVTVSTTECPPLLFTTSTVNNVKQCRCKTAGQFYDDVKNVCAPLCPVGKVGNANTGVCSCPGHQLVTGECVTNCYLFENGFCVNNCSPGRVQRGNICVFGGCGAGFENKNGLCVCPAIIDQDKCTDTCGNKFIDGKYCVPQCPPGKVAIDGRCKCQDDQYFDLKSGKCLPLCEAGKGYVNGDISQCADCPEGHFSTGDGMCQQCPASTRPNESKSTCVPCEEGISCYFDGDKWIQKECIKSGKIYLDGGKCGYCVNGKQIKIDDKGVVSCDACPAGTYSNSKTFGVCVRCPPGFSGDSNKCFKCQEGSYNDGTMLICAVCSGILSKDQSRCDECPIGKVFKNGQCKPCGVGEYIEAGVCVRCSTSGKRKPINMSSDCEYCPDDKVFIDDDGDCVPKPANCEDAKINLKDGTCCPAGFNSADWACNPEVPA